MGFIEMIASMYKLSFLPAKVLWGGRDRRFQLVGSCLESSRGVEDGTVHGTPILTGTNTYCILKLQILIWCICSSTQYAVHNQKSYMMFILPNKSARSKSRVKLDGWVHLVSFSRFSALCDPTFPMEILIIQRSRVEKLRGDDLVDHYLRGAVPWTQLGVRVGNGSHRNCMDISVVPKWSQKVWK